MIEDKKHPFVRITDNNNLEHHTPRKKEPLERILKASEQITKYVG